MLAALSLLALAGAALATRPAGLGAPILVARQGTTGDFGALSTYCTCPTPSAGQTLGQVNAYLTGGRNYFLNCQYGPTAEPCTYSTAGAGVNLPASCAANSLPAAAGADYCFVTCPATLNGQTLDPSQSNVVILASGTSYTSCRYSGGAVCQYNPATGALGNAAANNGCPATNSRTSGCCFTLDAGGSAAVAAAPASAPAPAPASSTTSTTSSSAITIRSTTTSRSVPPSTSTLPRSTSTSIVIASVASASAASGAAAGLDFAAHVAALAGAAVVAVLA